MALLQDAPFERLVDADGVDVSDARLLYSVLLVCHFRRDDEDEHVDEGRNEVEEED